MSVYHLHVDTPVPTLLVVLSAPVTVGMSWLLMEDLAMVGIFSYLLNLYPISYV